MGGGESLFTTRPVASDDEVYMDSDDEDTESSDFDPMAAANEMLDYDAASARALIGSPVIAVRDISTPEGNPMNLSITALNEAFATPDTTDTSLSLRTPRFAMSSATTSSRPPRRAAQVHLDQ